MVKLEADWNVEFAEVGVRGPVCLDPADRHDRGPEPVLGVERDAQDLPDYRTGV